MSVGFVSGQRGYEVRERERERCTYESNSPNERDIGNPSDSFKGLISSFLREHVVRSVSGSKVALCRSAVRHTNTTKSRHRDDRSAHTTFFPRASMKEDVLFLRAETMATRAASKTLPS